MANPRTEYNCRHGGVGDLAPGVVLHTHQPILGSVEDYSDNPHASPNCRFSRWLVIGDIWLTRLVGVFLPREGDDAPFGRTSGVIDRAELAPRLANDNIRIEVSA